MWWYEHYFDAYLLSHYCIGKYFPSTKMIFKSVTTAIRMFSIYLSPRQVLYPANLSLNQVIAVDGRGHSNLGQAWRDELQHGHLGSGILHGHSVRAQAKVTCASFDFLPTKFFEIFNTFFLLYSILTIIFLVCKLWSLNEYLWWNNFHKVEESDQSILILQSLKVCLFEYANVRNCWSKLEKYFCVG